MVELTEEQRKELAHPKPLLIDPLTREEYVLVRKEVYERLAALLDQEGPDMRAASLLVDRAMREDDADDPSLAYYQQKYGRRP